VSRTPNPMRTYILMTPVAAEAVGAPRKRRRTEGSTPETFYELILGREELPSDYICNELLDTYSDPEIDSP
jgi:hypothetical protein